MVVLSATGTSQLKPAPDFFNERANRQDNKTTREKKATAQQDNKREESNNRETLTQGDILIIRWPTNSSDARRLRRAGTQEHR